jgi:hypothetical protein
MERKNQERLKGEETVRVSSGTSASVYQSPIASPLGHGRRMYPGDPAASSLHPVYGEHARNQGGSSYPRNPLVVNQAGCQSDSAYQTHSGRSDNYAYPTHSTAYDNEDGYQSNPAYQPHTEYPTFYGNQSYIENANARTKIKIKRYQTI